MCRLAPLVCLVPAVAAAEPPDLAKYVTVTPGTIPVILSAPHGGRLALPGVPVRTGEGDKSFVTVRDDNTAELADRLADELAKVMGGRPFVVVSRIERKQIDPNRPADEAYESAAAKPYYDAYHAALADATKRVRLKWGRGLLLDLHGQGQDAAAVFRGTANRKTVEVLQSRFGYEAVAGPGSVCGRLEAAGFAVQPGKHDPQATKENPKYDGGYIVRTYGSGAGTGIDAIQLEFGGKYRATPALGRTAADVAAAVAGFAKLYLPAEPLPGR